MKTESMASIGCFETNPVKSKLLYRLREPYDPCLRNKEAERLIIDIYHYPALIYQIPPVYFEIVIERLLQDVGFKTELTSITRDGGKDVIGIKNEVWGEVTYYFECKGSWINNPVGVGRVRSLYGVQTSDRVNVSVLVTTGRVTDDAWKFVKQQNTMMGIIGIEQIYTMIKRSAEKLISCYNNT